jgi:hypothetical protein
VSEFTLANGLRVVVVPDHRVPVVTHMVWYAVGAADEGPDEHGVAHYLEHMMFKGTAAYPKGALDRFVTRRGGWHNATTSMDNTNYFQRLPKSALPHVMAMEADRMVNLRIDDADVASERAVVLEKDPVERLRPSVVKPRTPLGDPPQARRVEALEDVVRRFEPGQHLGGKTRAGTNVLSAYLRNVRLALYDRAQQIYLEASK